MLHGRRKYIFVDTLKQSGILNNWKQMLSWQTDASEVKKDIPEGKKQTTMAWRAGYLYKDWVGIATAEPATRKHQEFASATRNKSKHIDKKKKWDSLLWSACLLPTCDHTLSAVLSAQACHHCLAF